MMRNATWLVVLVAGCGSRRDARPAPALQPSAAAQAAPAAPASGRTETAEFAMGCFWGAEEHFFHLPGVLATRVGYAGGTMVNPSYQDVGTDRTGHAETVEVRFDPARISYHALLKVFWESHDPTQGDRQGNDVGNQYRSAIFTHGDAQARAAAASRAAYQAALHAAGHDAAITTEIKTAGPFYQAEAYHQQYCIKNPHGYCGHGGIGVAYPGGATTN